MADSSDGHPVLRLDGVTKAYQGKVALATVSLTIGAGEKVVVVGPSGSGKTTLLHLLAGVIRPDAGSVSLNGHTTDELSSGRALSALVGVVHQQFDLVPHLSVISNVLAGRLGQWTTVRSLVSLVWPQERHLALEALRRVGLADKLHERTASLSGGEQQRVAIARLLVQDPKVVVADEPVASLDPPRAEDLMNLLSGIAGESGRTLVASLHSVELVRRHFSRVIALRNGELQFDLPVSEVTDLHLEELYELEGLVGDGGS